MKTSLFLAAMRSAVLGLVVAVGISAHGAVTNGTATEQTTTTPAGKTEHAGKKKKEAIAGAIATPRGENEVGMLDHAYGILSHADHDYDGHRKHAMHQIEDAARILGAKLSGDGRGDEKQGTSDTQLHKAQSLLEGAVGGLKGKAHHHIEEAIKQLTVALRIK